MVISRIYKAASLALGWLTIAAGAQAADCKYRVDSEIDLNSLDPANLATSGLDTLIPGGISCLAPL